MAVSACDHFSVPCQGYSESSCPRFVGALKTLSIFLTHVLPLCFSACCRQSYLEMMRLSSGQMVNFQKGPASYAKVFIRQSVWCHNLQDLVFRALGSRDLACLLLGFREKFHKAPTVSILTT